MFERYVEKIKIKYPDFQAMTERLPVSLMQNYLNHVHHLFIDNYYTFISLAKYLLETGTHVTGTVRENRKQFPVQLKELNLEKEEAAHYQHEGIVVTKYRVHKDKATGKPRLSM